MIYRVSIIFFSFLLSLNAHAITAYQDQLSFSFEELESLGGFTSTKQLSADFLHHNQLVNPFGGPVDEAAFLNRIGSIGGGFNYIQVDTDLGGAGNVDPTGFGYKLQLNYVLPNKPLTASLKLDRQSIEDTITGALIEVDINSTLLSVGLYLDSISHINFSVYSNKLEFHTIGVQNSEIDINSLKLAYKKVLVNPGKKSFNFEVSYEGGDQQFPGSNEKSDFSVVRLLTDVYFDAQSRFGVGYAGNSDKNTAIGDSRTITLRGATYLNSFTSIGFNYFNTKFDAAVDDQKSFLVYYKKLMK